MWHTLQLKINVLMEAVSGIPRFSSCASLKALIVAGSEDGWTSVGEVIRRPISPLDVEFTGLITQTPCDASFYRWNETPTITHYFETSWTLINVIPDSKAHYKRQCFSLKIQMRYFETTNEKWWCWGNQKDNIHSRSVGLLSPKEAAAQPVQIKATFCKRSRWILYCGWK